MDKLGHCIADANIFIDFAAGKIPPKIIKANFQIITTDFVADEMSAPAPPYLTACGVSVIGLGEEQIARLLELVATYPRPSFSDLSALAAAEYLNIPLLTGDKDLRSAADDLQVVVHGTIWLLDRFVENSALDPDEAADALHKMINEGRRLPKLAVTKRLAVWKK